MTKISHFVKNPWVIIVLVVSVLIFGAVWFSNLSAEQYNEGVNVESHVRGNVDATVTLTEYSDFECPACGQFQPVVNEVMAQYGDQIKFEYKHFPLVQIHKFAESAARAAEAAGQQGKFFEFGDMLFANQAAWTKTTNPAALYTQYASELGLDLDLFAKHQRAPLLKDRVKSDMMEARGMGLTGTPTFFLNGKKMEISSYDDFKAQIAAALNPQVDFSLPGEALKIVPVAETSSTTPVEVSTSTPAI